MMKKIIPMTKRIQMRKILRKKKVHRGTNEHDACCTCSVTKSGEKSMEKTDKFATCGQAGSGFKMLNTHSGNVIISGIPKEISKTLKFKTASERFDGLFELTSSLNNNDFWKVLGFDVILQCSLFLHEIFLQDARQRRMGRRWRTGPRCEEAGESVEYDSIAKYQRRYENRRRVHMRRKF